jgi:DNA modification methylase
MEYEEFIENKKRKYTDSGFEISENELNNKLFDFQKHIVKTALKKGKYCIFSECGTGKTFMQIEWANQILRKENKSVLIITPLAVSLQTIQEGHKLGVKIEKYKNQIAPGIYVINYEQIEKISMADFVGVVLDESGILKNFTGAYRNLIIESCRFVKYKLACTATPSPNDDLELGSHAEFIDDMTSQDMRAVFFTTEKNIIHGEKYRLKRHAEKEFYKWISTWATVLTKPSDLGYSDVGYNLPEMEIIERHIKIDIRDNNAGLFNETAVTATTFNQELRLTMDQRIAECLEIIKELKPTDNCIVWVKHNEEADILEKAIPGSRQVKGSDSVEKKEQNLIGFSKNEFRFLITKAKIAQFGLNYQNCHNQIFCSFDFSFESLYQAIRRSYRFGQKEKVNIFMVTTDTMENVLQAIESKKLKFDKLRDGVVKMSNEIFDIKKAISARKELKTDNYKLILNDCIQELDSIETESIDYSFFSPPFGALYVFSDNPLDLSNVSGDDEFFKHFQFLVPKLFRVIKPGRLISMHVMQSTTLLGRDGFYSIKDFRGDLIRLFQKHGFYFHAENMIRKDPKMAAIRTKNHQLMHGTTKRDSAIVRPGLADYIITFRKPGENKEPIRNNVPFDLWCKIAEPVWIDVNESDTISFRGGRSDQDEKHITATQLQPIEWLYTIWTNEGDTVLSPFMGIGSEGYKAIEMGRKFIGIELKESYYEQAIRNLEMATEKKKNESQSLFDLE